MAKTYTLTIQSKYYGRSKTLSASFSGYSSGGSTFGYTDAGYYGCVSMFFNATDMAHLASLPASVISSASMKLTHSEHRWGETYRLGVKSSTSTTEFKISSSVTKDVSAKATSTTIDVKSLGIPSTGAYVYGIADQKAEQPTLTTAVLTVKTTESDYRVTYNSNGGTGAPAAQDFTVVSGSSVTLSSTKPTRTGYTFLGWSTSSTATSATYSAGGTMAITASVTLYAVWEANSYTVTLDPNGGSVSQTSMSVTYDAAYGNLPTPIRPGYRFDGWALNGELVTADTKVSTAANHTLIAGWTVQSIVRVKGDDGQMHIGVVYVKGSEGMHVGVVYVMGSGGLHVNG